MMDRPATVLRCLVPRIASVQSLDQRISKIQFQTKLSFDQKAGLWMADTS